MIYWFFLTLEDTVYRYSPNNDINSDIYRKYSQMLTSKWHMICKWIMMKMHNKLLFWMVSLCCHVEISKLCFSNTKI